MLNPRFGPSDGTFAPMTPSVCQNVVSITIATDPNIVISHIRRLRVKGTLFVLDTQFQLVTGKCVFRHPDMLKHQAIACWVHMIYF